MADRCHDIETEFVIVDHKSKTSLQKSDVLRIKHATHCQQVPRAIGITVYSSKHGQYAAVIS